MLAFKTLNKIFFSLADAFSILRKQNKKRIEFFLFGVLSFFFAELIYIQW
jgi:hypothetical protein